MARAMIPSQLRGLCGGAATLDVPAATLEELLKGIDARCPGFYERVVDDGQVRPELAVAIDGEAMTFPLFEPLRPNAEVAFVPAIGGG